MIIIGGLTRLTHSGLSITEWKPITGILPPISDGDWQNEFSKYQQTPEFKEINFNLNLSDFKFIYLMEFVHRLAGRIIGVLFIVPFLYFTLKKHLKLREIIKLGFIFSLGMLQGFIGWYMVKSGLINKPDISQYRLALHLIIAVIIYSLLFWQALNYSKLLVFNKIPIHAFISLFLILMQIISGAFVAGLDAGLVYNSFPLMDGKFIPEGLTSITPKYLNLFENVITVQFIHRVLAMLIVINTCYFAVKLKRNYPDKILIRAVHYLIIMLLIQVTLGITTLLYNVPTLIASLHQIGAIALFTVTLFITHYLYYKKI
jgi:cytochrome c oxidase assembly protein subunit 15